MQCVLGNDEQIRPKKVMSSTGKADVGVAELYLLVQLSPALSRSASVTLWCVRVRFRPG